MAIDGLFTLFEDVPGTPHPEMGTINPAASPSWPPGHAAPRNGHAAPRAAGGDLLWAFDWSIARGVVAVDPRGMSYRYGSLEECLRSGDIPRGATLVGESTFESYDLRKRQLIIDLAESRGITLLTVPARGNTRRREALGQSEKTRQSKHVDTEDALAIQYAALSGAHLKKPAIVDEAWAALREEARRRFIYLRCSGQKEQYAKDLLPRLPPIRLQPVERMIALGRRDDGRIENYNLIIVAAVGVAAEFVSDRPGFERLTGLYAHGYPSQFRSDLYYWGWKKQPVKQERITLRAYRRELRWLFHQLKGER